MAEKKAEVAVEQPKTFDEALLAKLGSVKEALPDNFNASRFVQNSIALLNDKPELTKFKQSQIMSGLLKGSYLGLDFLSNEAYLVPYGGKLQFMPSYKGAKKIAKKYSVRPIKDIYAKLVRQGDVFAEKVVNGQPSIDFTPLPFNDAPIIGAFAVVLYEDGGMEYDSMSLKDLENTRKSSKAKNSPAWTNFTGQMYLKTVLHRLCKHIELDFENPKQNDLFISGNEVESTKEDKVQVDNPFSQADEVEDVEDAEFVEVVDGEEEDAD